MGAQTLVWSAAACEFPGAGVYVGLSPHAEHFALARGLSLRQVRIFADGSVTVHDPSHAWLINYFAVRDPSCVRVKPVGRPRSPGERPHVELVFRLGRPRPTLDALATSGLEGQRPPVEIDLSAFVLTVGLPITAEEDFYRAVLAESAHLDWDELYERVALAARRR